jgi:hypothetical protein
VGRKRRGGLNCKLGLKDRSNIGKRKRLRISHPPRPFFLSWEGPKENEKIDYWEVKEGYPKETWT